MISFHFMAQNDLAQELAANKWFSDGSPKYTSCFYSKTPVKGQSAQVTFLKSGKIVICDTAAKHSFTESGKEVITRGGLTCDSNSTYVLKKYKIHITEHGSAHWYYRIIVKTGGLEFSPIYSEDFNKD
jgi:hypothetical protein